MDSVERLAYYLETDLGECADITLDDTHHSVEGDESGRISITPHEPAALPLRIIAGRNEIPLIEFDSVASHECTGNHRLVNGKAISPTDELGLMIAAVALHGATLYHTRLGRKFLVLGRADDDWSRRLRPVHSWAPIQPGLGLMLAFLQPPDYDTIGHRFFRIRTYRRYRQA